ncbi:MAG: signal peptidase II [Bacteroidota bacterium]
MRVLFLTGFIVVADQITKLMVKGISIPSLGIHFDGMRYGSSIPVWGEFFRLTYIENPGMAFGIDIGGKLFFSLFSVLASAAILVYLYKARTEPFGFRVALALILGGAMGNLIDRVFYGVFFNEAALFYGKVVDFFDVDFVDISIGSYHMTRWPVFNIADAAVTVGVVLLLIFHRTIQPITSVSGNTMAASETTPHADQP